MLLRQKQSDYCLNFKSKNQYSKKYFSTKSFETDYKPSNIFVLEDGQIRLADFGIAFFIGDLEAPKKCSGTMPFMAPEIFKSKERKDPFPFDFASDMWADGCTIYNVLSGEELFLDSGGEIERKQTVLSSTFESLMGKEVVPFKDPEEMGFLTFLKGMLRQMLDLDPKKRLAPEDGLELISGSEFPKVIDITALIGAMRSREEGWNYENTSIESGPALIGKKRSREESESSFESTDHKKIFIKADRT